MSKYQQRGAYHYAEFADPKSIYRAHVLDLLMKISDFVPPGGQILEIGAGEGLILSELEKKGFDCIGCDTDRKAVDLAEEIDQAVVLPGSIEQWKGKWFDAVLLCDVLEHVQDMPAMVRQAQELATIVVIAVPDRPDRHAVHMVDPHRVMVMFDVLDWRLLHDSRRHARYLLIFKRQR